MSDILNYKSGDVQKAAGKNVQASGNGERLRKVVERSKFRSPTLVKDVLSKLSKPVKGNAKGKASTTSKYDRVLQARLANLKQLENRKRMEEQLRQKDTLSGSTGGFYTTNNSGMPTYFQKRRI